MKKKEISSVEIARLAGVSRSTVSRVVNNYANVPPETRERVMQVIREHNYFPNASAQMLAGKGSRTLGLFLIEPGHVAGDILTNLLIVSVIEQASSLGYYVLTHIIRDPSNEEGLRKVREAFFQRRIDGGIFIGASRQEPFLDELSREGFLLGIFDQEPGEPSSPGRLTARFDNRKGMELAVEHLSRLGHTKIGIISGDLNRLSGPEKLEGFKAAMAKQGLELRPEWVYSGNFSSEGGYEAMRGLPSDPAARPTALVAANDSAAFGVIRALGEKGIQVPKEMSVIGMDDHPLSAGFHPPLTTIRYDMGHMLEELTSALIAAIDASTAADGASAAGIWMDGTLIVRESTCPPLSTQV